MARGIPITAAITYLVARTANHIPEFRYRIRDDVVVEYDIVHPASTVMAAGDSFTFAYYEYHEEFPVFVDGFEKATALAVDAPTFEEPDGEDDLLFLTAIPWVAFTSVTHPIPSIPIDSIPRFAWGKFIERGSSIVMPLSVQGHHALIDGLHVGRYFEHIQELMNDPASYMAATT
jgi:chloramphenicol O-acetyltransferase type A